MARKKRQAPAPPTLVASQPVIIDKEDTFYLFNDHQRSDDDERSLSNSSPTSRDSGVTSDSESVATSTRRRCKQSSSRDSSASNRSSIVSQDSLDLRDGGLDIPPAPPIVLDSLKLVNLEQNVDDNRPTQKEMILTAKGTLKRRAKGQKSDFQFHLNENCRDSLSDDSVSLASEEDFAGIKRNGQTYQDGSLTIRSHRGTVRGVKHRVRAGIATFLRNPTINNFKEREQGSVVVYFTSLGVVRPTWARCVKVRQILRNLLIKVDERDLFMSKEIQMELMDRMSTHHVTLPQVYVNGEHLGDSDIVEKLNESGDLRHILRAFKSLSVSSVCGKCGGFRMLPCPVCNGSKKSMHRNDFTAQFIALRCTHCDDCGLIKCDLC